MSLAAVDVVIVSWNTRDRLERCLLLLGGREEGPHIIVIDNASKDGSADLVARRFPWVTLVRNAENRLFAPAVNQGAALGKGEFLLLLNPDCELERATLAVLMRWLVDHPACSAVAPRLVDDTGRTQAALMAPPHLSTPLWFGTPLERLCPESRELRRWFCRDLDLERSQPVEQPPAACFLVRRSVFEALAGMDEGLALFFNDADLCLRLRAAGGSIQYLADCTAVHHTGSATAQLPDFASHWHRDRLRYQRKHFGLLGGVLARLGTTLALLDHLCQGILRRLKGKGKEPLGPALGAYWRFLRQ